MDPRVSNRRLFLAAVVDDSAVFRRAVRSYLNKSRPWQVVAEIANGANAPEAIRSSEPDAGLLDLHLPRMDGYEIAKRVLAQPCPPAIVFLTMNNEPAYRGRAQAKGAAGLVVKDQMFRQRVPLLDQIATQRQSA